MIHDGVVPELAGAGTCAVGTVQVTRYLFVYA